MGFDEGFEVLAEGGESGFAIEGLAHAEAGDDDVGLVVLQSGFLGGEIGGAIAGAEHVSAPAEVADGDGVFLAFEMLEEGAF